MTNHRRNQSQAATRAGAGRRSTQVHLHVVPRAVAAEQSAGGLIGMVSIPDVAGLRPNFLRRFDFHPALTILTAVAIVALVCIIYLGQVTAVINANYTLQALQEEHTRLLREHEDLMLQIGRAQSLPAIERIAREKLKMQPIGDSYSYLPVPAGPLTAMTPLPTPALPGEGQHPDSQQGQLQSSP